MSGPLHVEARGPVTVLTLHRPKRRNALSGALITALRDALVAADGDPGVRAIVLTGAGKTFCAGGDLGAGGIMDDGLLAAHHGRGVFAEVLSLLWRSRTPVVAAVNGDALGGGCGLAAACTLLVADPAARFSTPELSVGLFPMMIYPVLDRSLPRKLLSEMVLTGRRLSAEEALSCGLANRLSAPGESVSAAMALAELVASRSPAVVALGLAAAAVVEDLPLDQALAHMNGQLTLNLLTEDASEGIQAFIERRKPEWKGR